MQRLISSTAFSVALCLATLSACTRASESSTQPGAATTTSSSAKSGSGKLSLTLPTLPGLPADATIQFVLTPTSGGSPITLNQAFAAGNVATISAIPANDYTLQVNVLDANGNIDWSGSTPVSVTASQTAQATVILYPGSGGTAPAGTGSVAVTLEVGPFANPINQFNPTITSTPTVTFGTANNVVITSVTLSAGGSHVVGGGGCLAPAQQIGLFADCTGGFCSGDQVLCATENTLATVAQTAGAVVNSLSLSAEGQHSPTAPLCPSGTPIGTITDCGGGTCSGLQSLCATVTQANVLADNVSVLSALSLTPEGTHIAGGIACVSPAVSAGAAADCGGGSCSGDQTLCQTMTLTP